MCMRGVLHLLPLRVDEIMESADVSTFKLVGTLWYPPLVAPATSKLYIRGRMTLLPYEQQQQFINFCNEVEVKKLSVLSVCVTCILRRYLCIPCHRSGCYDRDSPNMRASLV